MNITINELTYGLTISLYHGTKTIDIKSDDDIKDTHISLNPDDVVQLDIVSTLASPFFYGSFIYKDAREQSKFKNLLDMPLIHGIISFYAIKGNIVDPADLKGSILGNEFFIEDIFITGIETVDNKNDDNVLVKFHFASSDILKFESNVSDVSTFDKNDGDKEQENVNDVIKKLFGSAGLGEKLNSESFTVNTDKKIKYIATPNETLSTALEYVLRKSYDDDFENVGDTSYVRIVYNHTTHEYEQWTYDDVGTEKLKYEVEESQEVNLRTHILVDISNKSSIGSYTNAEFSFENSGNNLDFISNFEKTEFIDYDYKENTFKSKDVDCFNNIINKNSYYSDPDLQTKTNISSLQNLKVFPENAYSVTYTTSQQNGSVYDIITDYLFNSTYYRATSVGSIGRRAGESVIVSFNGRENNVYSKMNGDYLIVANINRYQIVDGNPTLVSIMDLHKPYVRDDVKTDSVKF